jgi:hypothetical protein
MASPAVSVVVPTRDRIDRLLALLHSLERQELAPDELEVLVVDDASERPLEASQLVDEAGSNLRLRVLRHESSRGPAAARNTGWRAGRARLIAFTDDDCEADPGWLRALMAAAGDRDDVIVQGRTRPQPDEADRLGPFSRTQSIGGPDGLYETCNLAFPRSLLARVGGFDESFRHPCGEDVDLGLRAIKAGARLVFAPQAVVFHAVHEPGVWKILRGMPIWTDAVRVVKLHPELRTMLVHRVFWKRSHPPLILALAALILAAQLRRFYPLLLLGPYVEHYRRTHGSAGRPWPSLVRLLPAHLAVDLTELLTMLGGSAKHRTLML